MTTDGKCPHCGDADHIYGRSDIRWDPSIKLWVIQGAEETLECTECDESFYYGEAGLPHPDEQPDHNAEHFSDWQYEVGTGTTTLGYRDWLVGHLETLVEDAEDDAPAPETVLRGAHALEGANGSFDAWTASVAAFKGHPLHKEARRFLNLEA